MKDSLIAELDRLDALPWSNETYAKKREVLLRLFGSSARDEVRRALIDALPMQVGGHDVQIRAVLFDEHDPLSEKFPDNPWGIRPHHSLVEAIDHVWDFFDVPALTTGLLERVMGLVLIEDRDELLLGYLHVHELDDYQVDSELLDKPKPPHDRRHAVDWIPYGDITMFVGHAPSEATESKYGHKLYEPLRRFYRVHAGLQDGMWHLSGPDGLLPWNQMLDHDPPKNVGGEDEEIRSDQLLSLFGYGDDRTDLFDIRDPDEWLVVQWGEGHLYDTRGTPFGEWLEEQTSLILHYPDA